MISYSLWCGNFLILQNFHPICGGYAVRNNNIINVIRRTVFPKNKNTKDTFQNLFQLDPNLPQKPTSRSGDGSASAKSSCFCCYRCRLHPVASRWGPCSRTHRCCTDCGHRWPALLSSSTSATISGTCCWNFCSTCSSWPPEWHRIHWKCRTGHWHWEDTHRRTRTSDCRRWPARDFVEISIF